MRGDRTAAPAVWFVTAGLLAVSAVVIVAAGRSAVPAIVVGAAAAFFVAMGLYVRGHAGELARNREARRERTRASMRRHPLLWLLLVPAFAAVDGALRINRFEHHSATTTAMWAAGSALFGLVIAVLAIRRARRESRR